MPLEELIGSCGCEVEIKPSYSLNNYAYPLKFFCSPLLLMLDIILWGEIKEIEDLNLPRIIAGDFNYVTAPDFKKGCKPFEWGMGEFDLNNLKSECGLIDLHD